MFVKRIVQYLFVVLIAGMLSLPWQPSLAQSFDIELASVIVNLLPEQGRPSMLVIIEISLGENIEIPQELIFQVPVDADILSVASRAPEGRLILLEWETTAIGDWQDVKFSAVPSRTVRIEYYDPNLIKSEAAREFTYQWLSIYDVEQLSVIVRQPFGASDIVALPSLGQKLAGESGTFYYTLDQGKVEAGVPFMLNLTYVKDPGNLSYPALEVSPISPIDESTPGRTPDPIDVVYWLFAVAIAVLVMVGLYYWWFRVTITHRSGRVVQGVGIMNPEKQAVFCHECGNRSKVGDHYCRNCGTELRRLDVFHQQNGV